MFYIKQENRQVNLSNTFILLESDLPLNDEMPERKKVKSKKRKYRH